MIRGVWLERPLTGVPEWSGRGRQPRRERLCDGQHEAEEVARLAARVLPAQWQRRVIKEGSKGPMVADCWATRVVAVRDGLPGPEVWLVLRRHIETGELKTYVCNAPASVSLETLARLSGMRWPIETCFEESKQYLGMGDYEGRSWRGWHHHMTLCILAHFFLVRQQQRLKKRNRRNRSPGPFVVDGGLAQTGIRPRLGVGGFAIPPRAKLCGLYFASKTTSVTTSFTGVKSRCSTIDFHKLNCKIDNTLGQ
jgi:SRSO17 transposase